MVSDEVFTEEMHRHLKAQNICKKDRDKHIYKCLNDGLLDRDAILDTEARQAAMHNKKEPIPTEFKEQCDFVAWFKKTYPGVVIMSIRNHGYRKNKEKTDQMLEGLHPGAADLFIPAFMLWIEMKRSDGGSGQSDVQKKFESYVKEYGYEYLLCSGAEEAKNKMIAFNSYGNVLNK